MGVCIETRIGKVPIVRAWTSHPIWVCILKQCYLEDGSPCECHTLYGCVYWNLSIVEDCPIFIVTPYMGVCIETVNDSICEVRGKPHPIWVCVLKQYTYQRAPLNLKSHPIWVCVLKPANRLVFGWRYLCHTLYGCVYWNHLSGARLVSKKMSHPIWVCVLKQLYS